MRGLILASTFFLSFALACGLFEDAKDRLDSDQARDVCEASCDRQRECDDQFDVAACYDKCNASEAAWYLCPNAPEIADYIEMCNAEPCENVSACLEGRPDC